MTRKSELRDQIDELRDKVNQLLETNGILESWRASWLNGYDVADQASLQTTHGAFTSLLQRLGVEHMTGAVMRIDDLLKLEQANPTRLELQQKAASAEGNIRIHQLAIRQLEFQRDRAEAHRTEDDFKIGNLQARCEELEELLREILQGNRHQGWQLGTAIPDRIEAMVGDDK